MQVLHWEIDPELKREAEENYRTDFALSLKDREPLDIIRELTFDGAARNITVADIEKLFHFVEKKFLHKNISGIGLEVGGGPGTFSSILAKRPTVTTVYDIEVCQPIVEVLGPKVSTYILGADDVKKVVGVVGDFDHIELPVDSVDFIFDFFSLHHSMNPTTTLTECYRVLKPGGFVFCFDKARPDYYTKEDLNRLLDVEYDENYNKQFGLPLETKMTRRMNGEKEYRLKDWKAAFRSAGFVKFEHYYLAKTGGSLAGRIIKNLSSCLPVWLQIQTNKLIPKHKYKHKFLISSDNRIFAPRVNKFPKEISLMIAYKQAD